MKNLFLLMLLSIGCCGYITGQALSENLLDQPEFQNLDPQKTNQIAINSPLKDLRLIEKSTGVETQGKTQNSYTKLAVVNSPYVNVKLTDRTVELGTQGHQKSQEFNRSDLDILQLHQTMFRNAESITHSTSQRNIISKQTVSNANTSSRKREVPQIEMPDLPSIEDSQRIRSNRLTESKN